MQVAPQPKVNKSIENKPRRVIGKYFLSKTLGSGSMGKVKLALNTETKEKVAVKIVPRKPSLKKDEKNREIRIIKEASMMLLLDHPNIAKVYEMDLVDDCYYLFMEYVDGGQLLDYIISHGRLKEVQARHIARQIASAIDYCHRNSIVHRDLKVENILISNDGTIKVIDFGLSNVFSPNSQLSTFCGSLYFAAPELLEGKLYVGPEVDVWSFGVVLYVLVCGEVPFDDPSMQGMHAKVKSGIVNYPSYLSSDCVDLLKRMMVVSRETRATMTEVIGHPWLNKGFNAPVDNHLPKRKPLQLPIDMNVVHGMQGFEFGTAQDIKAELESIISSREYQQTATDLQQLSNRTRRASFSLAMTDPQSMPAAYHPLISIYYLVQERMALSIVCEDHTPVIGVSYTAHGKSDVREVDVESKPSVFKRLGRRLSRTPVIHIEDQPFSQTEPTVSLKRSVSAHVPPPYSTSIMGRRKSAAAAATEAPVCVVEVEDAGQLLSIPGSPLPSNTLSPTTLSPTTLSPTTLSPSLSPSLSPTLSSSRGEEGHADDRVKSVYIKGLFSVSTTSTKKASSIRLEVIRVLEKLKIDYGETRGRFECTSEQVQFDIYIVKIPWLLGMRGIQFRRVGGDPFRYKDTCSKILDGLKL